jgi:hypothetical protein
VETVCVNLVSIVAEADAIWKKSSKVWSEFSKTENGNKCNICGRLFASQTSTSSLEYHLSKEHKTMKRKHDDSSTTSEVDSGKADVAVSSHSRELPLPSLFVQNTEGSISLV